MRSIFQEMVIWTNNEMYNGDEVATTRAPRTVMDELDSFWRPTVKKVDGAWTRISSQRRNHWRERRHALELIETDRQECNALVTDELNPDDRSFNDFGTAEELTEWMRDLGDLIPVVFHNDHDCNDVDDYEGKDEDLQIEMHLSRPRGGAFSVNSREQKRNQQKAWRERKGTRSRFSGMLKRFEGNGEGENDLMSTSKSKSRRPASWKRQRRHQAKGIPNHVRRTDKRNFLLIFTNWAEIDREEALVAQRIADAELYDHYEQQFEWAVEDAKNDQYRDEALYLEWWWQYCRQEALEAQYIADAETYELQKLKLELELQEAETDQSNLEETFAELDAAYGMNGSELSTTPKRREPQTPPEDDGYGVYDALIRRLIKEDARHRDMVMCNRRSQHGEDQSWKRHRKSRKRFGGTLSIRKDFESFSADAA